MPCWIRPGRSSVFSLVDTVFLIELPHAFCVVPDEKDVDDERALRAHVERKWPAREIEGQLACEIAHHERDQEPDRQQHHRQFQVLAPVLSMLLGQLHKFSSRVDLFAARWWWRWPPCWNLQ